MSKEMEIEALMIMWSRIAIDAINDGDPTDWPRQSSIMAYRFGRELLCLRA